MAGPTEVISVVLAICAALGLVAGEAARRLVGSGRFRRADDDRPARGRAWGWWAPPAGAAGAAVVWQVLAPRSPATAAVALVAVGLLLLLALVDADVHRLPDVLTVPLAAVLLLADTAASVVVRAPGPLTGGVLGGAALFVGFCLLAVVGSGLGFGDVKLAGACGIGLGALGWTPVVALPVIGFVLGGLGAVALLASGRATRTTHIALGPALAAGAVLATAFG